MAKNNLQRTLWQVLMWSGSWLLISLLLTNGLDNPQRFINRGVANFLGMTLVVAININFLLPYLFFQKRKAVYIFMSGALVFIVAYLIHDEVFPWAGLLNPELENASSFLKGKRTGERPEGINSFRWLIRNLPLLLALLGSTAVEIARYADKKEKETIRSEKEKLETELKFLKSQVNPHFLFNALNNIYSLAVAQAPQTPESVMQLSEILRYMVYDSNEEKVPLKSEISYIENYVNLKMLKDSRGMDIKLNLDKSRPDLLVPPLLFIPFVENAFKHSKIENLSSGHIRIDLTANSKVLELTVANSLPESNFTKDKVGGVGLKNIKNRLELLFPGPLHELNINRNGQQFKINLKLFHR